MIEIVFEDPRWTTVGLSELAEAAAEVTLPEGTWDVAVLACDDARIAELNAEFRGKPQATNVLSWPSETRAADNDGGMPSPPKDPELGDIAIAYDTCVREAEEQGKHLPHHVTHLFVHGLLHLLGYDHERDADATLMERLETDILGQLGIKDPYSDGK